MRGKSFGTTPSPVQRVGAAAGGGPVLLSRIAVKAGVTRSGTVPSGCGRIKASAIGGGASGVGYDNNSGNPTFGGGTGAFARVSAKASPGTPWSASGGAGGAPQSSNNQPNPGGDSTLTLNGVVVLKAAGAPSTAGASAAACIGDVIRAGANGLAPVSNRGGTGGTPPSDNGDDFELGFTGKGGITHGAGARGGGGGGCTTGVGSILSGAGGDGDLIIEFWSE